MSRNIQKYLDPEQDYVDENEEDTFVSFGAEGKTILEIAFEGDEVIMVKRRAPRGFIQFEDVLSAYLRAAALIAGEDLMGGHMLTFEAVTCRALSQLNAAAAREAKRPKSDIDIDKLLGIKRPGESEDS